MRRQHASHCDVREYALSQGMPLLAESNQLFIAEAKIKHRNEKQRIQFTTCLCIWLPETAQAADHREHWGKQIAKWALYRKVCMAISRVGSNPEILKHMASVYPPSSRLPFTSRMRFCTDGQGKVMAERLLKTVAAIWADPATRINHKNLAEWMAPNEN